MTAKTLVRERAAESSTPSSTAAAEAGGGDGWGEGGIREITARNVRKVTRYREGGMGALEREVRRLEAVERRRIEMERREEGEEE